MNANAKTTFAAWRNELGLTIEEAARLLGLGRGQIIALSRGIDGAGRPVLPKEDTRLLMSAVQAGVALRPWQLSDEEIAAQRAVRRNRIIAQRRARTLEAA